MTPNKSQTSCERQAKRLCEHFDLPCPDVRIVEETKYVDGRYVPRQDRAPAQIFISSTHDPCRSTSDILLHELAHHLQHQRYPGSAGDHGDDFFQAIFDVVTAHYGDPQRIWLVL